MYKHTDIYVCTYIHAYIQTYIHISYRYRNNSTDKYVLCTYVSVRTQACIIGVCPSMRPLIH